MPCMEPWLVRLVEFLLRNRRFRIIEDDISLCFTQVLLLAVYAVQSVVLYSIPTTFLSRFCRLIYADGSPVHCAF